jgi:four helix bundle protein
MSGKVVRFEDLVAWQMAMELTARVYELTELPAVQRDFALVDQLRRAAISVPSNIAEGFERGTRAEFHHFLSIAKASCAELRTQLYILARVKKADPKQVEAVEDVARIIGKLRVTVGKQRSHSSSPIPHT